MEFEEKRKGCPSGNFDNGEANLCFKKSKNCQSLEIKADASESVARDDEKLPGWPGHSIFRVLLPIEMVRHLGRAFPLKALEKYEDIKAQIKFIVGPRGTRMVMVSAKEEPDSPLPPAVDGLLRVHKFFLDWLHDVCFPPRPEGKFLTKLLVPAVQIRSLINSSTIDSTEQECSCKIEISGAGSPALRDDLIVGVLGKSEDVHKAVESIASYLRKFLVDESIIPNIEMQEYHLRVQILQLYADAIIGIEGRNITCIRRLIGAAFTVEEMQEVLDQIVVMIDGSCSQVHNAERLMLMLIAEAGGPQSTDSLYKRGMSEMGSLVYYPQLKPSLAEQAGGDGSVWHHT